jgi:hypothetical protein
MKLREELQEEEVESRRRLAEADAQFAQLRRRLDDLLIEKEDLTEERDQWIEWHTEEVSELRGAEQKLERHEDELHRAKGFVAASLATVGNAEREAAELMGRMALFQQASADDEVVVEQWALAQESAVKTCVPNLSLTSRPRPSEGTAKSWTTPPKPILNTQECRSCPGADPGPAGARGGQPRDIA